jgi:NADPH:quinone reductase-like Zn-dependent oxidoreductase
MTSDSAHSVPYTMRAVQLTGYGGVDKLVYREDVPTPKPSAREVLIEVGACGVNNTDINLRTQWYDRAVDTELSEEVGLHGKHVGGEAFAVNASWNREVVGFPRIQGAAIVGRIVSVGESVEKERVGERVIVDPQVRDVRLPPRAQLVSYLGGDRDGGFAEYVAVPAENAHAIVCTLSDAELATFPTSYDTAEEMLYRTRLSKDETVLVTGAAGGVGTALIQLASLRGARIVAVASSSKEMRIRALGAHEFIPREAGHLKHCVEAVVGEQGIDVVVDVVGGAMFVDLVKLLCRGGRYASAGAIGGPVQQLDLRDLIYKDLEMYGVTSPTKETFSRVIRFVTSGRLSPLLEKSFALVDLPVAQTEFVKRKHVGKFVVVP